jgi:hypothetical protein
MNRTCGISQEWCVLDGFLVVIVAAIFTLVEMHNSAQVLVLLLPPVAFYNYN